MTEKELVERSTPMEEKVLFHEKKIRETMLRITPLKTEFCFVKWGLKLGCRVKYRGNVYVVSRIDDRFTHLHHKKPMKPILYGKKATELLDMRETQLMGDWEIVK